MKIFYIQPVMANYRTQVVEALSDSNRNKVWIFSDKISKGSGFKSGIPDNVISITTKTINLFNNQLFYQNSLIYNLLKIKPDVVVSFANPRYFSFWILLLLCKIINIKFFSHGQGLYAYKTPSFIRLLMYKFIIKLSTIYICYTPSVEDSFHRVKIFSDKIKTASNSIVLSSTVTSSSKSYEENGILFIGRLRHDCRLEILIDSILKLRANFRDVTLHVVGDGELYDSYIKKYQMHDWILWHGSIHDHATIASLSLNCRIGCYPGDAGLSVVHMFGLSLPVLVHGTLEEHMGPEPSYVINNFNGVLFNKKNYLIDLPNKLEKLWNLNSTELKKIGNNAFQTYIDLNTPPLGQRFLYIVENNQR